MRTRTIRLPLLTITAIVLLTAGSPGQGVYEPAKNSAERKAIFDALRVPVERDLKQKVSFVANDLKVSGNWAFVTGEPRNALGRRPDYSRTRYRDAVESGAFDNNFYGLLRRTAGKWKTVAIAIGCTDVCYLHWPRRYRAPKAIFPLGG